MKNRNYTHNPGSECKLLIASMGLCYRTRMDGENLVATIIIILAPAGLIYSWVFYLTRMRREPARWRHWVTLSSMALVSVVVLLWPIMLAFTPRTDWGSGLGVGHQVEWLEAWHRPIFRTLLVALVLAWLGRPRLIAPIALACIGTAMFWLFITMPERYRQGLLISVHC